MILIADSGSTKTDWALIDNKGRKQFFITQGLNPYFVKPEEFIDVVSKNLNPSSLTLNNIYYYGAGCGTDDKKSQVEIALRQMFSHPRIEVNHDLMGAARATCQHERGLTCILGTGSHACIWNGEEIVNEAVSLGFILGDEGGGAHLGKQLVIAYLYNELPEDLLEKFVKEFQTDKATILENVYRKPFPNRYLAGFVPFLVQHKSHKFVSGLVANSFELFINHHIKTLYNYQDFQVNFVGSVAFMFEPILKKKIEQHGLKLGEIMNKPIDGLVRYHGKV
ncbi:MAG TPA: N-acetylglucosamine kinase [Flavobacteriales bacterium]|nr:N-acetylglucosamine kinase [Flavobacteriales bacterium]